MFRVLLLQVLIVSYCHTGTSCPPNDIRLMGGRNENEGRLEVCHFGKWGTVCNDGWNFSSTTVACRQLGTGENGYAVYGYPVVSDTIVWSEVRCSGVEQTLSECEIGATASIISEIPCQHTEDVQLVCLTPEFQPECESGSIRLAEGSETSGRLEICMEGVWGTVCSRSIRNVSAAAAVVCNQLGINFTKAFASGSLTGVGPIFLRGLQCNGDENNILDCQSDTTIPYDNCLHKWDIISIHCYNTAQPECADGDVRLVDGGSNLEGRLEVCQEGIWGSVCDDGWTEENSLVVCRQLGINVTNAHFARYGDSSAPYFLNDVRCSGNEESIVECNSMQYPSIRTLLCNKFEAVGILCRQNNLMECMDGEVRLVDSSGVATESRAGVVQLCNQSVWTTLCDTIWGVREATTACRDLKLPILNGVVGFLDQNTSITGPTAHVSCFGPGNLLSICSTSSDCNEHGYAAIFCGPPENPACSDDDLRLTGADSPNEGRLEICHLGLWGTICDDLWTPSNTNVACRQLGFEVEGSTYWSGYTHTGTGPIFIDSIVCKGDEINITSCTSLFARNLHNCVHFEDVYLFCPPISEKSAAPNETTESAPNETIESAPSGSGVNVLAVVFPVLVLLIAGISLVVIILVVVAVKGKGRIFNRNLNAEKSSPLRLRSTTIDSPTARYSEANIYDHSFSSNAGTLLKFKKTSTNQLMSQLTSEFRISNRNLTLLTKIGEGEFGVVYKADLRRSDGQSETVAVKTLKGSYTDTEIDDILEEAIKLKNFIHPNVLSLKGVSFEGSETPYIITPYMMNGSLLSYLRKEKRSLVFPKEADKDTVEDVSKRLTAMCQQISCGMEYLAGKKFVHRDLAARNCMIDDNAVIKIADFGLSEEVYSKTYFRQHAHHTVKLPIKWMAIESLHEGIFSEKTDVWSFGITCWEVFSGGKTPYPGISPPGVMEMLENGERLATPNNAACTSDMYDLMKKCWLDNPNNRPTFSTIRSILEQSLEEMADYLSVCLEIFPEIHQEVSS